MALKLKLGYEQAKFTQDYQILADVISMALGAKKKKPKPVKTFSEAVAGFTSIFGKKST